MTYIQEMEKEHHEIVTKLERDQDEKTSKLKKQHQDMVTTLDKEHQDMVGKMAGRQQELVKNLEEADNTIRQLEDRLSSKVVSIIDLHFHFHGEMQCRDSS